jgi:hypothetical protein
VEDTRFDDMTKVLGSLQTRRLTLGAVLGGTLGALGLAEAEAAKKKKKRKKKCKNLGECQRCQRGKKKSLPNGTSCQGGQGICQDGRCGVQAAPVTPLPPDPVACNEINQACAANGECCNASCGKAFFDPALRCCNPPGTKCSTGTAAQCCSGVCETTNQLNECACKGSTQPCNQNKQCCSDVCQADQTCL